MKPKGVAKLKDVINPSLIDHLAVEIQRVLPSFDKVGFVKEASHSLGGRPFFDRISYVATVLSNYLPREFSQSVEVLLAAAPPPLKREGYGTENYHVLVMTRYISLFGIGLPNISLPALVFLTRRYSAEFDMRYFIERYPTYTLDFLENLALSHNFHDRRLASEASRPRLPMARHLSLLKQHPLLSLRIIAHLKKDPIRYVQRSVANHIADILKDNPDVGFSICSKWSEEDHPVTRWIVLRALRKPIREHNPRAMLIEKKLSA